MLICINRISKNVALDGRPPLRTSAEEEFILEPPAWTLMFKTNIFTYDHTHHGTPFLRPSAYKLRVEGVSPRCRIDQIRTGGSKGRPHPSESGQYLNGEKFIPPTIPIYFSCTKISFNFFNNT